MVKIWICFSVLAAVENLVAALPSDVQARNNHGAREKRLLVDSFSTPISVTGDHEFIAPDFDAGDQRGPCPGLNALANHGYISRNGITGLFEVTTAINTVYGMGMGLATLLATIGTVFVGNPLSLDPGFSIGSYDSRTQNLLGGLGMLGTPRGLVGSHNILESDSSLTREDLYAGGDASTMNLSLFKKVYDMMPSEGSAIFDIMAQQAATRFQESIATNPNFYYGPFTGSVARNAGYLFVARLFSNYSAETASDGLMNKDIFRSFFAVDEVDSNLTYNEGHERIPENWYRRPLDYDLVDINLDLLSMGITYPELLSIGGNTGSVDSFMGVDVSNITGGVLNTAKMLEGNNLLCFSFQVVKTVAPNVLSSIFSTVAGPLATLTDALGLEMLNLACSAFEDLTMDGQSLFDGLEDSFPGAKASGSIL